jgi:glutathionyl-hydroquinone reductase
MPIKLNFKDDRIIVDVNFLQLEEFIAIKNFYGAKKKDKMDKLFLYIYYMFSLDEENSFRDLDGKMKKEQVIYRVWKLRDADPPFTEKEKELYNAAADAYVLVSSTEEERAVEELNRKMEQLRETIRDTKPKIMEQINPNTGVTSFVTNIDIINKAIKELPTILEVKEKLIASMKRQSINTRNRGGTKQTSFREKGML